MLRFILLIFIFPLCLFAKNDAEFSELFSIKLSLGDVEACKELLQDWERTDSSKEASIIGLRATIALLEGDLPYSTELLYSVFDDLEKTTLTPETIKIIKDYYKKAWDIYLQNEIFPSFEESLVASIILSKHKASSGIKLKYWFGISQIVAACIIAPFNPPVAVGLAMTGINTTISAASDAIDSKDEFERNLNDRQKMTPDNTTSKGFLYNEKSLFPFIVFKRERLPVLRLV